VSKDTLSPLTPKPSLCVRRGSGQLTETPAFPFLRLRSTVSGKRNREQVLGKWLRLSDARAPRGRSSPLKVPNRERELPTAHMVADIDACLEVCSPASMRHRLVRMCCYTALAIVAAPSARSESGEIVKCKSVCTWSCSPEGVCIDSPRNKGSVYQINVVRRTLLTPKGMLKLTYVGTVNNLTTWRFEGGSLTKSDQNSLDSPERPKLILYYLKMKTEADQTIELRCNES
jgi:hypothetical protein